ncbi:MAG TPA: hypothetical protein VF614_11095 [Chthoniobacteraceae bacterium]
MRSPRSRFAHLLLIAALCAATGVHWVAVQSVAWATMLVTYSAEEQFGTAVAKTFDGEHPCDLCKLVTEKSVGSDSSLLVLKALDYHFPPSNSGVALYPPAGFSLLSSVAPAVLSERAPPLSPPPRFV